MSTSKIFVAIMAAGAFLFTGCSEIDPAPFGANSESGNSNKITIGNTSDVSRLQTSVPLATAANFSVLAGTTVTNDGTSVITQNIGVSPGIAIKGFQPSPMNTIVGPGTVTSGLGIVKGTIYAGGPVAAQAHNDAVIAYDFLAAQAPTKICSGVTQLNGMTFTPGVYRFAANLQLNGTVYLDFQGNNDAQFIFQIGSNLVTMAGSNVIALNTNNKNCIGSNVFWVVGSCATINGTQFIGNVIAKATIATCGTTISGRIWALSGSVAMIKNTINACGSSTGTTPPSKPCSDFVTGGGWIDKNGKSTFGVSGGIKNQGFWGQLSFNNHAGVKVKSTRVTNYLVIDAWTRRIEGEATINGAGSFTYTVVVADKGEPGRNDSFSLTLSNGYHVSGTLGGGNIQLHKNCGETKNNDAKENYDDKYEREGNKNSGF